MSLDDIMKERRKTNKSNATTNRPNANKNNGRNNHKRTVVKRSNTTARGQAVKAKSPTKSSLRLRVKNNKQSAIQVGASRGNLGRRNSLNKRRGIEPKGRVSAAEVNRDVRNRRQEKQRGRNSTGSIPSPKKPTQTAVRAAVAAMKDKGFVAPAGMKVEIKFIPADLDTSKPFVFGRNKNNTKK